MKLTLSGADLLSVLTGSSTPRHPMIFGYFPLYMNVGSGSSSAGKQQQNIHNVSSTEPDCPDDPLELKSDEFKDAVSSLKEDSSDEEVSDIYTLIYLHSYNFCIILTLSLFHLFA